MSGEIFIDGRVGVIIEVAPNQFVQYVMTEVRGTITANTGMIEEVPVDSDLMWRVFSPGITRIDMRLTGVLTVEERMARPPWADAAQIKVAGQIGDGS